MRLVIGNRLSICVQLLGDAGVPAVTVVLSP